MKRVNKIPVLVVVGFARDSLNPYHRAMWAFWDDFRKEHGLRYKFKYYRIDNHRIIQNLDPKGKVIILGNPPVNAIRDRYFQIKFAESRVFAFSFDPLMKYPFPIEDNSYFDPLVAHWHESRQQQLNFHDRELVLTVKGEYHRAKCGIVGSVAEALVCHASGCLPLHLHDADLGYLITPFGSNLRIRQKRDMTGVALSYCKNKELWRSEWMSFKEHIQKFNMIPAESEFTLFYRSSLNTFLFSRWGPGDHV